MMNYKRNHKFIGLSFALALMSSLNCQAQLLPTPTQEAKPGVRWWWMGSAVDQENLKWNLGEYAKAGIGAVEITPLYGVQGNDKNDIPYLSPKWMDMLKFVEKENKQVGIETDMAHRNRLAFRWSLGTYQRSSMQGGIRRYHRGCEAETDGDRIQRATKRTCLRQTEGHQGIPYGR